MSKKRQKENRERRAAAHARFGPRPRCALCEPLLAAGIVTGCNGWADDADEIKRRGQGGSITDMDNVRPAGRRCHDWVTTHPQRAHELGLVRKSWERPDG